MYVKYILILLLLYLHIFCADAKRDKTSNVSSKKVKSGSSSKIKLRGVSLRANGDSGEGLDGGEDSEGEGDGDDEFGSGKSKKYEHTAFLPILGNIICMRLNLIRDSTCGYLCRLVGNGQGGSCNENSECICDAYDIQTEADEHPSPRSYSVTCRFLSFLGTLPCTLKCQFLRRGHEGSCETGVCKCKKMYRVSVDKLKKKGKKEEEGEEEEEEDLEKEGMPEGSPKEGGGDPQQKTTKSIKVRDVTLNMKKDTKRSRSLKSKPKTEKTGRKKKEGN